MIAKIVMFLDLVVHVYVFNNWKDNGAAATV